MFVEKSAPDVANSVEAVQDGRIHIEKINAPFLFRERATPAEYSAGLNWRSPPVSGAGEQSRTLADYHRGSGWIVSVCLGHMRRGGWAPELFKPSGDSSASRTVC